MKINNLFLKKHFFLYIPLILVMVLDCVFTLVGQPVGYWRIDYSFFNEASPLGSFLLSRHPGFFVLFFILYILFVLFLITNTHRPLNIIVALSFFLGHSLGSICWFPIIFYKLTKNYVLDDWYLTVGFSTLLAIISGLCIDRWLKNFENV